MELSTAGWTDSEMKSPMNQEMTQNSKPTKNVNEVKGQSFAYMAIFYGLSLIVIASMILQYIAIKMVPDVLVDKTISVTDAVLTINSSLPYEGLIYSLIAYAFATFGLEGTRSFIMSMNVSDIQEKAKNMPSYKRGRLIQMIITFTIMTLLGITLQMCCVSVVKADFHLVPLYSSLGIMATLLAYTDFGPKLGNEIGKAKLDKTTEETK